MWRKSQEMSTVDAATTISVGVVDDDAIVRAWVRLSLGGSEFRVAGEAASAADALRLVERRRLDLLLVDFTCPTAPQPSSSSRCAVVTSQRPCSSSPLRHTRV